MRAKSLLLLIIALGCGTVASVGISQVMMEQNKAPAEDPTVEIFVTVKDIDVNTKLTPELFKLEKWPQNRIPDGAILKIEEIKDRFVRQRMYPGEPILTGKLSDAIVGVDTEIPLGYRVFDLSVNERNGGSGYIKPGARVDVLGTFKVNNVTESRTVMRNVRIFGINGVTVRDSDNNANRATTFQLLVHESQMEALNLATALGELRCTLRGTVENQGAAESTDTGQEFISWVQGSNTRVASMVNSTGSAGADIFGGPSLPAVAPATEEKKKELLIITPSGVTKYQWTRDDELPQRVDNAGGAAGGVVNLPPAAASLLGGLGGYAPVYPSPGQATAAADSDVSPSLSDATGVPEGKPTKTGAGSAGDKPKAGTPKPPKTGL